MLEFQALQRRFSAHLRDPAANPPPRGIEERRLKIYRELFFNNIDHALANGFPVLRRLLDDARWSALVRDFYARHPCHDPLFRGVSEQFVGYLESTRIAEPDDPPFMLELAHYEWVESALAVAEDPPPAPADLLADGDLLAGVPVLSPLAWVLGYRWPVHRIGPNVRPDSPGVQPTWLIVYRTAQDDVRFMEINALTAQLLEQIQATPDARGRVSVRRLANAIGAEAEALLMSAGAILNNLRDHGIVLGARHAVAAD
jgi:uncharacterized protein